MQGFINRTGKRTQGAVAEVLESRRLLSTVSYEYDYDPYYSAFGAIQIGDNATDGYYAELSAGIGGSEESGDIVWDHEGDDGVIQLDKDGQPALVPVELIVTMGTTDTISMRVGDTIVATSDQDILTSIEKVVIEAYAFNTGMAFVWSGLVVEFYSDGLVVDSASDLEDPDASTLDYSAWSDFEGVEITTLETECDMVIIRGFVQLTTDSQYFYPNDLFGQILIY